MKDDKEKKAAYVEKELAGNLFPYEKPRFESVKLFADEVLGGCGKLIVPPCSPPSESAS